MVTYTSRWLYALLKYNEQLLTFRGRCPFKQHIPCKPGRYGIKILAACDSKSSYVYNCQVYSGKTGDQGEHNLFLEMIEGLEKSGRNVTTGNFHAIRKKTRAASRTDNST